MSKHIVEVVRIGKILPHPDPEVTKLELTHVMGWQVVIGKGAFKEGDLAVYIEPDYMVPLDRSEFAFLKKSAAPDATHKRITVMRLRGALSQGLLLPVPNALRADQDLDAEFAAKEGDNLIDYFSIERYVPPTTGDGVSVDPPQSLYVPVFDVENHQRFGSIIEPGEQVVYTEKIHGTSSRFTYARNVNTGEMEQFAGSRTVWYQQDDKNTFWQILAKYPQIGEWCKANPEKVLYGEVFGTVQELKYGAKQNEKFFAAFAVMDGQSWMDWHDFDRSTGAFNVPRVPCLYIGPYDPEIAYEMAEYDSCWDNAEHCSEGIVVLPVKERTCSEIGRVMLKIVSNRYLEGGASKFNRIHHP